VNSLPPQKSTGQNGSFRDLAQRAISAAVLACVALILTIISPYTFTALIAVAALVLAWEWDGLTRATPGRPEAWLHAFTTLSACVMAVSGHVLFALAAIAAGSLAAAILPQPPRNRLWTMTGIFYFGAALLTLVVLRNDAEFGLQAILLLFIVVWSADTAAYFAGRAIGGPKLAPAISPGKTWSGFAAGLLIPAILAFAYAIFLDLTSPFWLAVVGLILAIASQLGDLLESAIKRRFDAKDSSSILPGHGGLFDRVDGLIGAALAAAILVVCRTGSLSPAGLFL